MLIPAFCGCGAQIEAPADLAGQAVKCPQCSSELPIPAAEKRQQGISPSDYYREDGQVPLELKERILADLGTNERLAWLAQPVGAIVFRRSLGYLIIGGLIGLLSLSWIVVMSFAKPAVNPKVAAAQKGKAPPPAPASSLNITIPTVVFLVGIGVALVPVYRWKMAQRTCYALTNRRAIVHKGGLFGPTRENYAPSEVAAMRRSDSWIYSGGGDLIFRTVQVLTTSYSRGRSWQSVRTYHYGFLAIDKVREVEKLVRETLIDRFVDKLTAANAL
jgi:hypothetical protein